MMAISPVVTQIGGLHFDGNIIPHAWYSHACLRNESGKPNMVAIILLSDILYWYRPTVIRNEVTGEVTEVRQKFRADKLQKSYEAWGEQFGFSRRQVQDAVGFLVERAIITRELRTVTLAGGLQMNNVVFLEPIVEAIVELSSVSVTPHTFQRDRSYDKTGEVTPSNVIGHTMKRTYTDITAETTSQTTAEKTTNKDAPAAPGVLVSPSVRSKQLSVSSRTQIQESFEAFWKEYPNRVAKQAAWVAWQKIKPDAETLGAILDAIPKQSSYRAACESRRIFCPSWPHPATWLNGQRWQDACELPTGGQLISHTGGLDVAYKETRARVEAFDKKYNIQSD